MAGAAEQKAVLPPINLMKPTHQFRIQTFFPNHVRLIRCGVKPQEPDVKHSMLSACRGEKLPCADPSAGRPCTQAKAFLSQTSLLGPADDPAGALACRIAPHVLGAATRHRVSRPVRWDRHCSLGRVQRARKGFRGCAGT